ncbi:MAG: hypothetical protein Q4G67_15130 [Actinomycetia bacterium]|nr:hypothetical protein [Actinomycetes bacterium]
MPTPSPPQQQFPQQPPFQQGGPQQPPPAFQQGGPQQQPYPPGPGQPMGQQQFHQQPPMHPSLQGAPPAGGPQNVQVGWPIPETYIDLGQRKVLIEPAITALVLILSGIGVLWMAFEAWRGITGLRFGGFGELPGELMGVLFATIFTLLAVAAALFRTSQFLIQMRPVARPLTILWAVVVLALAIFTDVPGWFWLIGILLALLGAGMYLSPANKRAFAAEEQRTPRPAPIEFSMQVLGFQILLMVVWILGLAPVLGQVSTLNALSEWSDSGPVGTYFAIGWVIILAVAIGMFVARQQVGNRQASGRVILAVLAVLNIIAIAVTFANAATDVNVDAMSAVLPMVLIWGAILGPLWVGQLAARWFNTAPVGIISTGPNAGGPGPNQGPNQGPTPGGQGPAPSGPDPHA